MDDKKYESQPKDLISIVLTYYNRQEFIEAQLDSLLFQTYKNWELIIVDDCSTDGAAEIIKKFIQDHLDKKIVYLRNEKNIGLAKNFEKGLQFASGQYIAVCDSDDVWFPDKLEKELEFLKKGNFGMVYSDLVVVDKNLKIIKKSFVKNYLSFFSNPRDDSFDELLEDNHITAPTILFTTNLKDKLIPFSEYSLQDYWIALVFSLFSTIGYLGQPTVYYRQHATNMVGAKKMSLLELIFQKNRAFLEKHTQMKSSSVLLLKDVLQIKGLKAESLEKIKEKIKKTQLLVTCLSKSKKKDSGFLRNLLRFWKLGAYREMLQIIFFKIF